MNKLQEVFANGKAFIPYITAGDPSLAVTEQLVLAMATAGVDLVELGIPFSDPVAEGPVIQAAHNRALAAGVTTDQIFAMLKRLRQQTAVPIALMTYANPIYVYGRKKFMKNCRETKVAAVIVPDVPFEEKAEFAPYCREYGIDFISLIAPTSRERIQMIAAEATGFIYCVSSLGVTGVRREVGDQVAAMVDSVKEVGDIPCAVGFGIGTPEQAGQMAALADGVIVGSAIVELIGQWGQNCLPAVNQYISQMLEVIKN